MENLTHTAEHVLEDFHSADLSQSEKKKISREISTALAAMTCLAAEAFCAWRISARNTRMSMTLAAMQRWHWI